MWSFVSGMKAISAKCDASVQMRCAMFNDCPERSSRLEPALWPC